jgi:biopolymer transport protein ExbB
VSSLTIEQATEAVQAFMERGGDVLFAVFAVTMLMWTLILERTIYMRLVHPRFAKKVLGDWQKREDHDSWYAHQIRRMMVAQVSERLNSALAMIKTCVALCPLLGLLGTVTGMIEVFDVMAVAGNGNPRAMASGVSMATIPTMAGMVAALSGVYFSAQLKNHADNETQRISDMLTS